MHSKITPLCPILCKQDTSTQASQCVSVGGKWLQHVPAVNRKWIIISYNWQRVVYLAEKNNKNIKEAVAE